MPAVTRLVLAGLLAVGLLLAAAPGAAAQTDTASVAVDSARVAVRSPSDTLLARFRGDPAYDYDRSRGWTWWRDLRRWVRAQLARLLGGNAAGGPVLQVVFYVVLAAIVGYAAYMLVQLRSDARPPGRTAPESVTRPQTVEEMRTLDYGARLEAAVAEGNYRRAVRLLYQQTLQRLDRAGAIAWRPSKTNRAYVNELDADARPAFSTLTRLFERVWYGGATVDADHSEQIRAQFASFWEEASVPDDAPAPNGSPAPPRDAPNPDRASA
jgi:hypothetical protein